MNLSAAFIQRPVATSLFMVAIFLSGLVGYRFLPQAPLPQVDYPTIQVVTRYPGASPEVMATAITAPLERQFGAMAGLEQMSSSSSAGTSTINLRFGLDLSLDVAEQTVQAAINAAANFLPAQLPTPPIYSKVNPADAPILTLAISSETLRLTEVQDLVDTRLVQKISQVPGVGLVSLGGGQKPAVRIVLNAAALASLGIGVEQVRAAIGAANSNQAKGSFDGPELAFSLETNGQLRSAAEYRNVVITTRNGAPVRISDVASVVDGAEDAYVAAWADGSPAVLLDVQRQPGANVIGIVDNVLELLPALRQALPETVDLKVLSDRTTTIRASIHDVQIELALAVALVVMVIFLFLRTFSATLIPALAVPLSLLGTFGVLYLLDFSINNLTLMALTIGTGFVVDDAIVMIENVARHRSLGKGALQAALDGAREIGFTIISLTCSLIAVLIPLLFMGDIVGRLFREFAVTLVIAIVISAVVSLTFTPMLCARLLGSSTDHAREAATSAGPLTVLIKGYGRILNWVLERRRSALVFCGGTVVLTSLLASEIPKGFFPTQDTGVIQALSVGPAAVSFAKMSQLQQRLAARIQQHPDVHSVASIVGIDGVNATMNQGRLLVNLKPHGERQDTAAAIAAQLKAATNDDLELAAYFQPVQDLTVDDRAAPGSFQYLVETPDGALLDDAVLTLIDHLKALPELTDISTDVAHQGLEVVLSVDRDRAGALGISMATIDNLLYSAFGQRYVSTIFTQTSQYRVLLETAGGDSRGLGALDDLHVTSSDGRQVRLSSLLGLTERRGPLVLHREKQSPSATIAFNLSPGTSLGVALERVEQARAEVDLPLAIQTRFQGAALAFQGALKNELLLLLASIVTMYIVLGILYESFIHPLTILSTLPSAGIGALVGLWGTGNELNVIAVIGIVLLIGIVQKNAIMIIDFALEAERKGARPRDAVFEACLLRFRPILMTTLAALLSAVPLVLGSGPGSELRRPLGIAMIGGLLVSQLLTLFTTPVIYLGFNALRRKSAPSEAESIVHLPPGGADVAL